MTAGKVRAGPAGVGEPGEGEIVVPKMKTHRGSAKRFHVTSGGKYKRSKAYASHILTKKTTKRKRGLRQATMAGDADRGRLKRLLPYS
jgi:large subunit ribosomal protein L35